MPGRAPLTFTLTEADLAGLLRDVFAQDPLDGYRAGLRRAIEAEAMDRLSVPEEHAPGVRR
ncbi:hypothetical protein CTI14_50410, partial [Methylobacterium radiotolerans]